MKILNFGRGLKFAQVAASIESFSQPLQCHLRQNGSLSSIKVLGICKIKI